MAGEAEEAVVVSPAWGETGLRVGEERTGLRLSLFWDVLVEFVAEGRPMLSRRAKEERR